MDEDIESALEEATDDPPREQVEKGVTLTVMPSTEEQLDEAGAGDTFVRQTVATATHSETGLEAEVQVASGDGFLLQFPDGTRVLLDTMEFIAAAALAVRESEYGVEGDD